MFYGKQSPVRHVEDSARWILWYVQSKAFLCSLVLPSGGCFVMLWKLWYLEDFTLGLTLPCKSDSLDACSFSELYLSLNMYFCEWRLWRALLNVKVGNKLIFVEVPFCGKQARIHFEIATCSKGRHYCELSFLRSGVSCIICFFIERNIVMKVSAYL